jgi:hypothetical protein
MTNTDLLWDNDEPVAELGVDVPAWIDPDITPCNIAAIVQGGCASGVYMPAVTYRTALETMHEHGNDILEYIEDNYGEIPAPPTGSSWYSIAVHYLSMAVEVWASSVEEEIAEILEQTDDA